MSRDALGTKVTNPPVDIRIGMCANESSRPDHIMSMLMENSDSSYTGVVTLQAVSERPSRDYQVHFGSCSTESRSQDSLSEALL